jgi:hypothetical protein
MPQSTPQSAPSFTPDAVVMQRGVLTVRGRQFTVNGYVAKSQTHGLRLVMTENFGGVLADVWVNPDGRVSVIQSKPPLRPEWVERYVASDLKCVFGYFSETNCPVQMLGPNHFTVTRRWYQLDLRTVEVRTSAQPAGSPALPGYKQ